LPVYESACLRSCLLAQQTTGRRISIGKGIKKGLTAIALLKRYGKSSRCKMAGCMASNTGKQY